MDPKLQELVARTNLDQLLPPASRETDTNQPVQSAAPAKAGAARSTTDPLQIHFATTDIVGKLHDTPTSPKVKTFALVFLGGPFMIFGLLLLGLGWSNPGIGPLRLAIGTAVALLMIGFWPYVIFARHRAARRQS